MKKSDRLLMLASLERAIELSGGLSALTRRLDLENRQTVDMWRNRRVPAERAVQIEQALNGTVKRHELRPDLFVPCQEGCQ